MSGAAVKSNPATGPAHARRLPWWGAVAAGVILIGAGMSYRVVAAYVGSELSSKVSLPTPLATLATTIGDWVGEDVAMSEGVVRIAGNDDFVNRRYVNRHTGQVASLYVGYTARPRTMLRHRPTVCYPSAGYSHLASSERTIRIAGAERPVLVHAFLKPGLQELRVIVLNFYVLSGAWTVDENSFWGLGWRTPNLARDAARYVAQVQLSCPIVSSEDGAVATAVEFLQAAGSDLLALLPGSEGVRVPGQ